MFDFAYMRNGAVSKFFFWAKLFADFFRVNRFLYMVSVTLIVLFWWFQIRYTFFWIMDSLIFSGPYTDIYFYIWNQLVIISLLVQPHWYNIHFLTWLMYINVLGLRRITSGAIILSYYLLLPFQYLWNQWELKM